MPPPARDPPVPPALAPPSDALAELRPAVVEAWGAVPGRDWSTLSTTATLADRETASVTALPPDAARVPASAFQSELQFACSVRKSLRSLAVTGTGGPGPRAETWETAGSLTPGENKGMVSGLLCAPSSLLPQEDPYDETRRSNFVTLPSTAIRGVRGVRTGAGADAGTAGHAAADAR
eukprot:1175997-Prorocentrum_minimum.AAC.1